jgi:hypothetical protein
VGKLIVVALVALGLLVPAVAEAAPPANDNRASAQTLGSLPASVKGTTVDAGLEENEPFSCQGQTGGSVWYELPAGSAQRDLVLELDADGDMDAVVDVYRRDRSQVTAVTCGQTNRRGRATLDFRQRKSVSYLIRVAPLFNSVADTFSLRVVQPDLPERPPGRRLPAAGASGSVDAIANPDDAYAVSLRAGQSYRVHLVSRGRCVRAALYPPGTGSFEDDSPVRRLGCNGYFLYTPRAGEGGRFGLQVTAPRTKRGALPYHVQVAVAGEDDTAPGLDLPNDQRVRGSLRGSGADVVDLYRFEVRRPSTLDLRLRTASSHGFNLQLLSGRGRRIACACGDFGSQGIRLTVKPGRFYAAVRSRSGANGSYRLSRLTRTITKSRVTIDGKHDAQVTPGSTVTIAVGVSPEGAGPVTVDVERFDPLAGWQFFTRFHRTVSGGLATIPFTPPSEGRWRVHATFEGNRQFAPSGPVTASMLVAVPIPGD